jgi:Tfp pilus assembly protein PilN
MTRINLLPPEIKGKAARPNIIPVAIISLIVVIVLLGGLWFYYHNQVSGKQDSLKSEQARLQELQKQVEEPLKTYEDQAAKLKSIQDLYAACNTGRVGWASMLNDLALYVPEGLTTASNPRAPAIWLTALTIDATSLEGTAAAGSTTTTPTTEAPVVIEGYAAPAWLCIQTWLPRASDFKAHGFLDAYPYYYYFRGQPKVAEFFVRLHNMEEWTSLWIKDSTQEPITISRQVSTVDDNGNVTITQETYDDWAIKFTINGFWNADKAPWDKKTKTADTSTSTTSTTGGGAK